jgi:hypothetical protein
MEVVAANFPDEAAAAEAVSEMIGLLRVDPDLISVDRLALTADVHPGEPVLVMWVRPEDRRRAREVIERHAGRHLPLDWLQAVQEEVAPESFSDPGA